MMPLQRACGGGSQVRNRLSNGPLRAQSNGFSQSILRRCRQAYKCRGYVGIPLKCMGFPVNQGGTADSIYSSLAEKGISVKDVFAFLKLL
jgi:hypothetical protein